VKKEGRSGRGAGAPGVNGDCLLRAGKWGTSL